MYKDHFNYGTNLLIKKNKTKGVISNVLYNRKH